MIKKHVHILVGIAIFLLLKAWYTQTSSDELLFLLSPTNKLVSVFTASGFSYIKGSGYFHPEFNILIEKSCAGFNFLILCYLISYITCLQHLNSIPKKWTALPICLLCSYFITIAVNTSRILISIYLSTNKNVLTNISSFHQLQGTFIYLFFLLLSYLILKHLLNKRIKNEELA